MSFGSQTRHVGPLFLRTLHQKVHCYRMNKWHIPPSWFLVDNTNSLHNAVLEDPMLGSWTQSTMPCRGAPFLHYLPHGWRFYRLHSTNFGIIGLLPCIALLLLAFQGTADSA
jgi:hypothetical protein